MYVPLTSRVQKRIKTGANLFIDNSCRRPSWKGIKFSGILGFSKQICCPMLKDGKLKSCDLEKIFNEGDSGAFCNESTMVTANDFHLIPLWFASLQRRLALHRWHPHMTREGEPRPIGQQRGDCIVGRRLRVTWMGCWRCGCAARKKRAIWVA